MIAPKTVRAVLKRDQYRCVIQGPSCTGEATVADHRANRGSGGSKALDAAVCLVGACRLCNSLKEDADGPYRDCLTRHGIRVVKAATNEATAVRCGAVPVLYWDGWHQLTGDIREPLNATTALELMELFAGSKSRMVA